jgi:DNA-binding transcriptional LysR family regulator
VSTSRLPVQVMPCPVTFPRMMYYQLWHERTHASMAGRWLREQIKSVAASLRRLEPDAVVGGHSSQDTSA